MHGGDARGVEFHFQDGDSAWWAIGGEGRLYPDFPVRRAGFSFRFDHAPVPEGSLEHAVVDAEYLIADIDRLAGIDEVDFARSRIAGAG